MQDPQFWTLLITVLASVGTSTATIWYRIGSIESRLTSIERADQERQTAISIYSSRIRELEKQVARLTPDH